jgi:hypothetical protein
MSPSALTASNEVGGRGPRAPGLPSRPTEPGVTGLLPRSDPYSARRRDLRQAIIGHFEPHIDGTPHAVPPEGGGCEPGEGARP